MAELVEGQSKFEVHFDLHGFFRILTWFMAVMMSFTIVATGLITTWNWAVGVPVAVGLVLTTGVPMLIVFRRLLVRDERGLWVDRLGIRLASVGIRRNYRWEHVGPIVNRRYMPCLMRRTSMLEVNSDGAVRHIPLVWFGLDGGAAAAAAIESLRPDSAPTRVSSRPPTWF